MSSGGRIFIVMLVLAFVATGLYYLATTRDAEPKTMESVVLEPVAVAPAPASEEPASPVVMAVPELPEALSSDVVSMRLVVSASNTLEHDVPALQERLRSGEPLSPDEGVDWFRMHDPALFADTPENMHQLLADPGNYFRDRFGYVVDRHDDALWILLDDARNVLHVDGGAVEVTDVSITMDELDRPAINVVFSDATRERLAGFIDANPYRPCGVLVNDELVAVPTLNERFLETSLIVGDFTPSQLTNIRGTIEGMAELALVELPAAPAPELAPSGDEALAMETPSTGIGDLTLMNTGVITDTTAPRVAPVITPEPKSAPNTVDTTLTRYEVKEGDTLSSIAIEWFGSASNWTLLVDANPTLDPDRLAIGQVLMLPPKDATAKAVSTSAGTHVVRSGDMLSRLAKTYYGHERHWQLIYEANKATIGDDPGDLTVGMTLIIPKRTESDS